MNRANTRTWFCCKVSCQARQNIDVRGHNWLHLLELRGTFRLVNPRARASLLVTSVMWHLCCDYSRRARYAQRAPGAASPRATTCWSCTPAIRRACPRACGARPTPPPATSPRRAWSSASASSGSTRRPRQAASHQGHGRLLLAHCYQRPDRSRQALLVGALLWRQLRCAPPSRLTTTLVARLGLPAQVTRVVVSDWGRSRRQLGRDLRALGRHSVARLRCNTVVYTATPPPVRPGPGRPRKYGGQYRVDALERHLLTATPIAVRGMAAGTWSPPGAGTSGARGCPSESRLSSSRPPAGRPVPASDRPHPRHGGDRGRVSRAPRHRAGAPWWHPAGPGPGARPLPWRHRPGVWSWPLLGAPGRMPGLQPAGLPRAGGPPAGAARAELAVVSPRGHRRPTAPPAPRRAGAGRDFRARRGLG